MRTTHDIKLDASAGPTPGRAARRASAVLAAGLVVLAFLAWNRGAAEPVVTDYVVDEATSPNWSFVNDRAPLIAAFVTGPDGTEFVDQVYDTLGSADVDEFRAGACTAAARFVFIPPWVGQVDEACTFLRDTAASRDEDAAYLAILMAGRLRDHCVDSSLARPFDQTALGSQFDWSAADVARLEAAVAAQAAAGCPS